MPGTEPGPADPEKTVLAVKGIYNLSEAEGARTVIIRHENAMPEGTENTEEHLRI